MTKEVQNIIIEYGKRIDAITSNANWGELKALLEEMEDYSDNNDESRNDAGLFYFLGTGYSDYAGYLARMKKSETDKEVQNARRLAMYYFRKALELYNQENYKDRLDSRIMTNYANCLDNVGRVIEALSIYRKILASDASFSIARGNYGIALEFLASIVNDPGHHNELLCYAYQALKKGLSSEHPDLHEQAIKAFSRTVENYEKQPIKDIVSEPIRYKQYSLGADKSEIDYRKWCLENHLFLNPLNDVMEIETAFAHDPLIITVLTDSMEDTDSINKNPNQPPRWFAMINQLKEEYVYARYLLFAGITEPEETHYADKDVRLTMADLDNCIYSIRIEQIKTAFRTVYSLLDQICFFVNDFWKMGFLEDKVFASKVYKANTFPKDNAGLTALYWVLCEFFEKTNNNIEPHEKNLSDLRHAMEHKYLKVHKGVWKRDFKPERDRFYHISEFELQRDTMRMLALSREALMYLVYAIGINENKKDKSKEKVKMYIGDYPANFA